MVVFAFVVVWIAGTSLLLAALKHATLAAWWEQVQLDIETLPTTTDTPVLDSGHG